MEIINLLQGLSGTNTLYNYNISEEIKSFINSGCNVNAVDNIGMTAMHFAIARSLHNVVLELIEHGADINAQDTLLKTTPLHQAVKLKNTEILCMLLCYGADVTITDHEQMTPLMTALDMRETEVAYTLLDFYDDLSQTNGDNCDALLLAARNKCTIVIDLVKAGASPICVSDCNCNTFIFSLVYDSADFFKLIWFKHYKDLLDNETPFLLHYLKLCSFKKDEWVECLLLILTCPMAMEFLEQYKFYMESHRNHYLTPLFKYLYIHFNRLQVHINDRLKIMCLCLSLGAVPAFTELSTVYEFYNFNDELEILIHAGGSVDCTSNIMSLDNFIVLYILAKDLPHAKAVDSILCELLKKEILKLNFEPNFANFFKYVFVPSHIKIVLIRIYLNLQHKVNIWPAMDAIEKSPTFPSLLDLTRNTIRNLLRKPDDLPYQFLDRAKSLMLPKLLKDVICFREPVYRL